jgi:hypothetical protein
MLRLWLGLEAPAWARLIAAQALRNYQPSPASRPRLGPARLWLKPWLLYDKCILFLIIRRKDIVNEKSNKEVCMRRRNGFEWECKIIGRNNGKLVKSRSKSRNEKLGSQKRKWRIRKSLEMGFIE